MYTRTHRQNAWQKRLKKNCLANSAKNSQTLRHAGKFWDSRLAPAIRLLYKYVFDRQPDWLMDRVTDRAGRQTKRWSVPPVLKRRKSCRSAAKCVKPFFHSQILRQWSVLLLPWYVHVCVCSARVRVFMCMSSVMLRRRVSGWRPHSIAFLKHW